MFMSGCFIRYFMLKSLNLNSEQRALVVTAGVAVFFSSHVWHSFRQVCVYCVFVKYCGL